MSEREVQFNHVFEQWADQYDHTVSDTEGEYAEVFEGYEAILDQVAAELTSLRGKRVLEIGVGTGNLTERLLLQGWDVCGVDPSPDMREIARHKLPRFTVEDGHFLSIPEAMGQLDGIVSTYALHHLTDEQKARAIRQLAERLRDNGIIVFADTAYADEEAKQIIHTRAREQRAFALLEDLQTEYYTLVPVLRRMFEEAGLVFFARQLNRYVWLFTGRKPAQ
ncbi:class I SAM-dependent methyltransferase [Aneurinibacillus sp. REN35]|uniref:class I SAM-dependent methyltransferase n=1 Tax=Aneurinibacillus sp. REN35 TaxID=3237286 RepID=UPI0035292D2F